MMNLSPSKLFRLIIVFPIGLFVVLFVFVIVWPVFDAPIMIFFFVVGPIVHYSLYLWLLFEMAKQLTRKRGGRLSGILLVFCLSLLIVLVLLLCPLSAQLLQHDFRNWVLENKAAAGFMLLVLLILLYLSWIYLSIVIVKAMKNFEKSRTTRFEDYFWDFLRLLMPSYGIRTIFPRVRHVLTEEGEEAAS